MYGSTADGVGVLTTQFGRLLRCYMDRFLELNEKIQITKLKKNKT